MNFELEHEHRMLADLVTRFVNEDLLPVQRAERRHRTELTVGEQPLELVFVCQAEALCPGQLAQTLVHRRGRESDAARDLHLRELGVALDQRQDHAVLRVQHLNLVR